jgi:hypothetical protein
MAIKGIVTAILDSTDDAAPLLTDTGTVLMNIGTSFSSDNVLTVFAKIVNVSGTTAGSTSIQWSVNGTDFIDVPDESVLTQIDGATIIWELANTGAVKYRVEFAGSGTHTSTCSGSYIYK